MMVRRYLPADLCGGGTNHRRHDPLPAHGIGRIGDRVGGQEQVGRYRAPPIRMRFRLLCRLLDLAGNAVVRLPFGDGVLQGHERILDRLGLAQRIAVPEMYRQRASAGAGETGSQNIAATSISSSTLLRIDPPFGFKLPRAKFAAKSSRRAAAM